MTQRADPSRDLLSGLIALRDGLIDPGQLVAAFQTWDESPDRSIAEILSDQGVLDGAARAKLDTLVTQRQVPAGPKSKAAKPKRRPAGPRVGNAPTAAAPATPGLAETVAHAGPVVLSGNPGLPRVSDNVGSGAESTMEAPRYPVLRPHARGGLGEVFLALDPELNREVALKELRAYHAYDAASQARFLLEARVTGRLEHPGVVPVYGLGRHPDGRPYYAMRFIEGETLRAAIERFHRAEGSGREPGERELSFRRLLRSLIDACNTIAYAHSRGVIHRDIKPENIMLGRFGETLVVDWGIAKPLADRDDRSVEWTSFPDGATEPALTRAGSVVGTPQYMSPEQARGEHDRVGPAADVYGLGATLYCLLAGHSPFPDGDLASVLERAGRGIFPAPRRIKRTTDPTLETICLKAMAPKPEDRHASPLALAGEIETWLADVRYRREQESALSQVKRTLVRLCLERARNVFARERHGEGMLWLARALENVPTDAPDLERVVRAGLNGWHAGPKLLERSLSHGGTVTCLAFSPDGRRLATGSANRTARLWDVATGTPLVARLVHDGPVRALAFSPDGQILATACDDGTVRCWDAQTGSSVGAPIRHEAPVLALGFGPDGTRLVTASRAGLPCLWATETGRPLLTVEEKETPLTALALAAGGRLFALAGDDGRVRIGETETGHWLGEPPDHPQAVTALAFDPVGRRLLTGCADGLARIWDISERIPFLELTHPGAVRTVAFSPDGATIATACRGGTARLRRADDGAPIGESLASPTSVDLLTFSPDGSMLATAGPDGTARLWDAATGLPLGPPLTHRGTVHVLAFDPDARRLATGGTDGSAHSWRVPTPVAADPERIACWVSVTTELEFDSGDAVCSIDPARRWELRRRLSEIGGPPLK